MGTFYRGGFVWATCAPRCKLVVSPRFPIVCACVVNLGDGYFISSGVLQVWEWLCLRQSRRNYRLSKVRYSIQVDGAQWLMLPLGRPSKPVCCPDWTVQSRALTVVRLPPTMTTVTI